MTYLFSVGVLIGISPHRIDEYQFPHGLRVAIIAIIGLGFTLETSSFYGWAVTCSAVLGVFFIGKVIGEPMGEYYRDYRERRDRDS
ncbi:hypothetical protein FSZ31_04310 [Sphingorhabdus soli]|uniref:Uncharacterized protein n=1 Tax=Flavisphingopyxis soli TaxID=2601267 RepID=A0A5C6UN29_9SPHN|nr:hypothetical protein [Sphingorhabdus soli]TXC73950.1 hypothetical protein FSZ31_04310 [Sphingorhabdus soli]